MAHRRHNLIPFLAVPTLRITTLSLPGGQVNVPYGPTSLAATGGFVPYVWTKVSGTAWINVSSAGVVLGTPNVSGTATLTVQVQDLHGALDTHVYNFNVAPASIGAPGPIGINFSSGGVGVNVYEGFPIYQDRVREGGGFSQAATNQALIPGNGLRANGWPSIDFGANLSQGTTSQSWMVGTWKCGLTGTGTEVVAAQSGCVVSNIVRPGGGRTTFDLVPNAGATTFGFKVTATGTVLLPANLQAGTQNLTNNIGYGSGYGTLSPSADTNGKVWAGIEDNHGGGFSVAVTSGTDPGQAYFSTIHIVGGSINVAFETVAASYSYSGGNGQWNWTAPAGLVSGTSYTITAAIASGATSVFAYMPGQGATTIVSGSYTYSAASLFTAAAISEYQNYGYIRFMHWSNAWFNTVLNTSFTRRTPSNTVAYQNWSNSGTHSEGYPAEWAVDFCKACGIGIWYSLPVNDDGSYTTSLAAMLAASTITSRIYIEYGNELWNGTGSAAVTFGNLAAAAYPALGTTQQRQQFYADQLHRIAVAFINAFGSSFGTRVKIVATWQAGNNGTFFLKGSLAYMNTTYGSPLSFVQMLGIAPYMSRDNTWVPGDGVNHVGSNDTVGLIQTQLTNNGTYRAWIMNAENDAILAMFYGLGLMAYEGRWEIGPDNTAGTSVNCGAAILDAGMQAVDANYYQTMFNSGFLTEGFTAFASGVLNGGAVTPFSPIYQHENNYGNYITNGAARLKAIQQFPNFTSYAPSRNVVNGAGSVIQGVNYADNVAAIVAAGWAPAASFGGNGFITGTPANNPYPGRGTVPHSAPGYCGWFIWCTAPGTYSLTVNFTTTVAGTTNVEYGSPGHPATIATGIAIANGLSNAAVACGNVVLQQGANYILLGNGTTQAGIAVNSLTFGGLGATFDFYISPTGNDAAAGTLAAPWTIASLSPWSTGAALTNYNTKIAGKRIGLLPGTHGCSALCIAAWTAFSNQTNGIALDVPGGTAANPTYIGSSSAGGTYLRGAATVAANDNGTFGGSNSIASSLIGQSSKAASRGFVTFDGLVITGGSVFTMTLGDIAGSNAAFPQGYVVQNCEFTGNSAQNSTIASGKNVACLTILAGKGALFQNNWFHDNFGWTDGEHFSAIYQWGLGAGTQGTQILNNTFHNSGGLQGKEDTQYDTTIAYNYIDMSVLNPGGNFANLAPIWGFVSDGNNGGGNAGNNGTLTSIHHNVLIAYTGTASINPGNLGGTWISAWYGNGQQYWGYPVQIYNNTCVATSSLNGCAVLCARGPTTTPPVTFYNNLFYEGAFNAVNQYGWFFTQQNAFALLDYNIYGTNQGGSNWANFSANGSTTLGAISSTATSFANWQALMGADAHSSVNATNPFTNNGLYALAYQVQSGSPAFNTGKVGGVIGGASCNVGAWDGTVTQIGCNFAT